MDKALEISSNRSDDDGARFEARVLYQAKGGGVVKVVAESSTLSLAGSFGELKLLYDQVQRLVRDVTGSVVIEAGGVRLVLDTARGGEGAILFQLLRRKVSSHRARFYSRDDTAS
jgi:hypothetical protein